MRMRKRIRLAYACDCAGERAPGRPHIKSDGTQTIREGVFAWTGEPQSSCPWRALSDPFVSRVLDAYQWEESGQISLAYPRASHRLIEGVGFYKRMVGLCQSKQMEIERERARKG
jgi:hypothetical protein